MVKIKEQNVEHFKARLTDKCVNTSLHIAILGGFAALAFLAYAYRDGICKGFGAKPMEAKVSPATLKACKQGAVAFATIEGVGLLAAAGGFYLNIKSTQKLAKEKKKKNLRPNFKL